jgi:hypothetical protein
MSSTSAIRRPDGQRAGSTGSEDRKAEMSETPKEMYNVEAPEHEGEFEMDEQEKNRILRKIDWAIVVRFRYARSSYRRTRLIYLPYYSHIVLFSTFSPSLIESI